MLLRFCLRYLTTPSEISRSQPVIHDGFFGRMDDVGPLTPDRVFATAGCLAGEAVKQRSETHGPRWTRQHSGTCQLTAKGAGATGHQLCAALDPQCTLCAQVLQFCCESSENLLLRVPSQCFNVGS